MNQLESKIITVYDILDMLGIVIEREMGDEAVVYCPFHTNTHSPAMNVNLVTGLWHCFNGGCGAKGNLAQLWEKLNPGAPYPLDDKKFKALNEDKRKNEFFNEIDAILNPDSNERKVDWVETLDRLNKDADEIQYMLDRGFTRGTLDRFEVSYSKSKNRIVIPVRDEHYRVVGLIGRAVDGANPKYLYTKDFPKKGVLFNLHHAKSYKSVILVEGSLDAMRVSQAGYPNVCAVLGSNLSDEQTRLIEKYFLSVIIFADRDNAGMGLANNIAYKCASRDVFYANWDVIDENFSDPGELSEEQIRLAIDNKIMDIEMRLNGL